MTDLKKYQWWGEINQPPENLKTKKQLSEMGLKPLKPVGVIHTNKYDCLLFDILDSQSVTTKKPLTEKQKMAIQRKKEDRKKEELFLYFLNKINSEYFNQIKWFLSNLDKLYFCAIDYEKNSYEVKKIRVFSHKETIYEVSFTPNFPYNNTENFLKLSEFGELFVLNKEVYKILTHQQFTFFKSVMYHFFLDYMNFPYDGYYSFEDQVKNISDCISKIKSIKLVIPEILKDSVSLDYKDIFPFLSFHNNKFDELIDCFYYSLDKWDKD